MSFVIINHKEVKKDILEAKFWYKNQQNGLEKQFASEVKKSIAYLSENPFLFNMKHKTIRIVFTEHFPYSIHYHINVEIKTIIILGIFHTSISPEKWSSRL